MKVIFFKSLVLFSIMIMGLTSCNTAQDGTQKTPKVKPPKMDIHAAVISGNLPVVKQHITSGTNLNMKDAMTGSTPLVTAVTFGKADIVKALIDAGADLSIPNNDGTTPLHSAAFFCRVEIVKMLLQANADKSIKNSFGATPRETVLGSFAEIKPVYQMMQQQLEPFGLQLDMDELEKTRPVIAMMLQ